MKKLLTTAFLVLLSYVLFGQNEFKQKIVGYVPSYGNAASVDYSKVTHANFCFLEVNPDGTLPSEKSWYKSGLQAYLTNTSDKNVQRVITLPGKNLDLISRDSVSLKTFSDTIVKYCQYYGFHGVDIDWEGLSNSQDSTDYKNLMIALKLALQPAGLYLVATIGFGHYWGQWYPDIALKQADWLQIMIYDQTGTWPESPFGNHSTFQHLLEAEQYWVSRGYHKEQLVMGLPFYGRKFNSASGGLGTAYSYRDILAKFPNLCDTTNQTPGTDYTFFNGPALIRKKCQHLKENDFGGVMIWELTQDAVAENSLLSHVYCTINGNSCYIKPCNDVPDNESALYLGDSSQYIEIAAAGEKAFHFKDEFTIEALIRTDKMGQWPTIVSNFSGDFSNLEKGFRGLWFGIHPTGYISVVLGDGTSNWYNLIGSKYLLDGAEHYVAVTFKNNKLILYTDLIEQDSLTVPSPLYDDKIPVTIGNNYLNDHFIGTIDELRIMNKAKTSKEIFEYDAFCTIEDPEHLVALYHFDDGRHSSELKDYSLNGYDGKYFNIEESAWVNGGSCDVLTSINLIQNNIESEISLFPNPAKGTFEVALGKTCSYVVVSILDMYGNEVYTSTSENSGSLSIDLNVPTGMYLVNIIADDQNTIRKLVIE